MSTNHVTRARRIFKARGWGGLNWRVAVVIAGSLGTCWALSAGYRARQFQSRALPALETVEVDQGDVTLVVTENGQLESSVDDVVRCGVESFLRLPVGASVANWEPRRFQARMASIRGAGTSLASGPRDTTIAAITREIGRASCRERV